MGNPKILLVYYSRTGTTKLIADDISAELRCDVEEIVDTKNRGGILGYLGAGRDAFFRRLTTLKPTRYDPANYDVIIVGTPVWNASVSAPVRTYLTAHKGDLKSVVFFCTYGGSGARRVFRQMADICRLEPLGRLDVREADVRRGDHVSRVKAFLANLTSTHAAA
jgi:flavodoxin